ncbi:hypothetical protein GCM10020358_68110 [Amorphoplanes nipponensis]|uniref:Lipoprotein LprG n=1 Tax=Actinoplanes nipponensis TaxID=135950 RepID=A0A919JLJ6_9ACTN|nr:hypothetical protein [Actinoplanes nipponensis]GIE51565.1 hypothetical protein Ani05nite_50990 [Actinoplanes nipponensis]
MRRRTLTAGTFAATAVLALTACTGTEQRESRTSTPPTKTPAAQLADAASRLKNDTFQMIMIVKIDTTDARLDGAMDPAKKIGAFTATTKRDGGTSIIEWRVLGDVVYLKTNTPSLPGSTNKPWRRINQAESATLAEGFDGAKMANPLTQATNVQRPSARHFTGAFATAAVAKALSVPTPSSGSSAAPAPTVAFTADLDNQGRLTRYHLDVPRTKGGTYPLDLTYSDFGTPVTVQAPPAEQIAGSSGI